MMFLRRGVTSALKTKLNFLSGACEFCSKVPILAIDKDYEVATNDCYGNLHTSPLFHDVAKPQLTGYEIELVDNESWRVSSSLAQAWHEERRSFSKAEVGDSAGHCALPGEGDPDFDDIDNLRVRGNLFYKIDRGSKEFEEYSYDFHGRKKTPKKRNSSIESVMKRNDREEERRVNRSSKIQDNPKESKRKQNDHEEAQREIQALNLSHDDQNLPKLGLRSAFDEMGKKIRTPTFNQLTGPFHEPFCLDIYISKASVRACVVHRVTSKVVAVAHSISKDMKFDLTSTRNATACNAVGSVLAERALADDIHDVVYTPRRGERLEGKLQLVLQSIIENGINVKVKLKQRKFKNSAHNPQPKT